MLLYLITTLLWISPSDCALTITPSPGNTLVQATYDVTATFTSTTIPASSVPTLTFSTHFLINSTSITSCQYAKTGVSSFTATTCSVTSDSSGYYVTFANVYSRSSPG